jgi:hypothetical protein
MSVKNCSRDVLVSRNSSQMDLDESLPKNVCKKLFDLFFYWNGVVIIDNIL